MDTPARLTTLPNLTGLRAIAALLVVGCHMTANWRPGIVPPGPLADLLKMGFQSVGFFFVLSGFILAYGRQELRSRGAFYGARLSRVMPAYQVGLALGFPFFLSTAADWPANVGVITGVFTLLGVQAWGGRVPLWWNSPGWSLSCELAFYLVFPVMGRTLARLDARRLLATIAALWIASVGLPTGYLVLCARGVLPFEDLPGPLYFNAPARLPEFLIGVALGRLYLLRPPGPRNSLGVLPGLLALGALALSALAHLPMPLSTTGLLAPLWCAMIWSAARRDGRGILASAAPVLLGEISYGVYILHWPLWQWWVTLWGAPDVATTTPNPIDGLLLVSYLITLLFTALLSFRLVETPMRRWLLRPRRSAERQLGHARRQVGLFPRLDYELGDPRSSRGDPPTR